MMTTRSNPTRSFDIAHTDDSRQNLKTSISVGICLVVITGLVLLAYSQMGFSGSGLAGVTTFSMIAVLCGIVHVLKKEGWQWS
jgi:uncharacterized membrane protein YGL010W